MSLDLFKKHLKWDSDTSEDDLMTAHLIGATKQAESYTRRVIGVSTWQTFLPGFASVTLDVAPITLSSIVVKYYDSTDTLTTLDSSKYTIKNNGINYAAIEFESDLPELYDRNEPVYLEYTAGYATVPPDLLIAIHRQAADYFETRTNEVSGSMGVVAFDFHRALFPYKML